MQHANAATLQSATHFSSSKRSNIPITVWVPCQSCWDVAATKWKIKFIITLCWLDFHSSGDCSRHYKVSAPKVVAHAFDVQTRLVFVKGCSMGGVQGSHVPYLRWATKTKLCCVIIMGRNRGLKRTTIRIGFCCEGFRGWRDFPFAL